MKTFLVAIFILVIVISAAVFGLKYIQGQAQTNQPQASLQKSLIGTLQPIPSVGEYSDVIVNGTVTTGVTSNTVNLKPYEGKKVQVLGEYSGNTMYADSITIVQ